MSTLITHNNQRDQQNPILEDVYGNIGDKSFLQPPHDTVDTVEIHYTDICMCLSEIQGDKVSTYVNIKAIPEESLSILFPLARCPH